MNIPHKLLELLANPEIAIPFWGALGGVIRVLFHRPYHWLRAAICVWLGSLFAYLFTAPVLEYLALPPSASSGAAAVLGILSYELARGLTQLRVVTALRWLAAMYGRK